MADQEDGSDFISIDDNAVSDGSSDANTRPEDTMLENILDANHRYLWERGSGVVKRFWASNEVDSARPFASARDEICIAAVPWQLNPGISTIEAKLHGRVDCDGPNTAPDLRVKLEFYAGESNEYTAVSNTTTVGRQVIERTVAFNETFEKPQFGFVLVWIKSEAQEAIVTAALLGDQLDVADDWYAPFEDTGTFGANLDERTSIIAGGDQTFRRKLYHRSDTVGDKGKVAGTAPLLKKGAVTLFDMTYIRPEKIAFRAVYDKAALGTRYGPKQPRTMEPQRAVKGADVSEHPRNADAIAKRPTCLGVGPIGEDDWEDTPTDYYQQYVSDMDPDTDQPTLDRQGVQMCYDGSLLRCMALIKGGFEEAEPSFRTSQDPFALDGPGGKDPTKGEFRGEAAVADMDLRLKIRQGDGTSWGSQTTATTTETFESVDLHRIRPQQYYDLYNTWFWALYPEGGDNQPADDFRWAFQEGTFNRNDLELFLPTPIQMTIDTSDLNFTRAFPIRVDLEFVGWSSGPDTDDVQLRRGLNRTRFGVVCLGTSYWEIPQL